MARLRQQNPQSYGSSGNINAEFENVFRYLNSAELGNKTIGELFRQLFDADGAFIGPVEMRRTADGLDYRVGSYTDGNLGWVNLATMEDLRGRAGVVTGEVGSPIFTGRYDVTATAGQTEIAYAHDTDDDILVFKNGLVQVKTTDYTHDPATDKVTMVAAMAAGDKVSLFRVRAPLISGYRRSDTTTVSTQQVFSFEHNEDDKLLVYKNGILQREGGSYDYTRQPLNSTITFNTALASGNTVSIIFAENSAARTLTGLMLEEDYVDQATGLLRLDAINFTAGGVAQTAVANLVGDLGARPKRTISSTTPVGAATGDLWLDTAVVPNQLKFYDGTNWLRTSPDSSLPTFTTSQAGRYVRVNGTGTGLEYATIDLSSVIPVTSRGAANGVASLDAQGRLPSAQLPQMLGSTSYWQLQATPANANYQINRIYRQKVSIDGISLSTTAGSCTVQITVGGVSVGSTYTADTTGLNATIATPIEVDAATASKAIGYVVTGNAAAANLEVTLSASVMSA